MRTVALANVLGLALAMLAPSEHARAHGGPPHPEAILLDPTNPDRLVLGATFGLAVSTDGGSSWSWTCQESIPGGSPGIVSPGLLAGDSTILIAGMFGLARGETNGCAWDYDATLVDRYVSDITRASDGTILVVTGDSGAGALPNYVYASTDEGQSFAQIGEVMPDGFLAERVRVAPSDGTRTYVSGQSFMPGTTIAVGHILRSDGIAPWIDRSVELVNDERLLRLVAVDPADPETVWMVAQAPRLDRLLLTHDGGDTVEEVTRLGALPSPYFRPFALVLAPDGSAWFGNERAGLRVRRPDGTIETIDASVAVSGLALRGSELFVCGNGTDDGFALARAATDAAWAPEPILQYAQIERRECGTDVDCTCDRWWPDFLREVGRGAEVPDGGIEAGHACALDAGVPDAGSDGALDAGTSSPPVAACSCRVAGARRDHASMMWLAVAALALRATKRRARGAPRRTARARD